MEGVQEVNINELLTTARIEAAREYINSQILAAVMVPQSARWCDVVGKLAKHA